MDTSGCMGAKCSTLANQAINNAKACSIKPVVKEDNEGCKSPKPTAHHPLPIHL